MTHEEIDRLWFQALEESIKDGEMVARYHFAALVTAALKDTVPSDCTDSHQPVAWIHIDPDKPRVKFLEWREDEPGYRGNWIKTPLYTVPQRCPNCASLQDQNTELDRKLAELTTAVLRGNGIGGK